MCRRKCYGLWQDGGICVNGIVPHQFGILLKQGDRISIADEKTLVYPEGLESDDGMIVLYHKPVGLVVTHHDDHEKCIFDVLPQGWCDEYFFVGRLDKMSSGLLLLTKNRKLVHELSHPGSDCEKQYVVKITGIWHDDYIALMKQGIRVNQEGNMFSHSAQENFDFLSVVDVCYEQLSGNLSQLTIFLSYGKKRHIRRLLLSLGLDVLSLHRVAYGPYQLGDIAVGEWKWGEVDKKYLG